MSIQDCCNIGFARVQHFGKTNVIRRMLVNLRFFLEWGFLDIGGWNDIVVPTGNPAYDPSELKLDYTPGYEDGQVWGGLRKHWVHETGVEYTDMDSIDHTPLIPTIYINTVVQSSGYEIDYDQGRVIFDSILPPSTSVKASYSFKNVQVYLADDAPWLQEIQFDSHDPTKHFQQDKDGSWFVSGQHRVQLPFILIEAFGDGVKKPFGLGDFRLIRQQDIHFHVFAADQCMRDNLVDLLLLQADKCIPMFNIDDAAANCDLQLYNYNVGENKSYPHLLSNYFWGSMRGVNAKIIDLSSPTCQLNLGTVKIKFEVLFASL